MGGGGDRSYTCYPLELSRRPRYHLLVHFDMATNGVPRRLDLGYRPVSGNSKMPTSNRASNNERNEDAGAAKSRSTARYYVRQQLSTRPPFSPAGPMYAGEIIRSELGGHDTPNLVAFKARDRNIGEAAVSMVTSAPRSTIEAVHTMAGSLYR